ncbi:HAD-IIB family hydrolase [Aurantiacibacter poecillastricola]|uniref:HAD-IIB family hydrolase n=1 Tax=Aurantiacibacter poecillastricola TaxID=3064385 RepID=UPI00273EC904|nr:HAD-IIB family hydrolase [Aurantiacibacter sp. 219JJ12-13]MDP5261147.1 HAD-IIB family hydrolase [Aurantiacibacter sp. 219JJ12-13]
MHIISLALGGCIKSEPVQYGITEDTGGHITYILGEMNALARHPLVTQAEIVTRLFDEPGLGECHAWPAETTPGGARITRIDSGNRRYLAKDALAADREAFTQALIDNLRARPRLPDCIHAHFADAADVARKVRKALGIPFVYTAHSLAIDKLDTLDGNRAESLSGRIDEETRAIQSADAIVASSRDECERQLLRYDGADATRIYRLRPGITQQTSGPDLDPARKLIAPFLREPGKPIILAIARPVEKKNLVALVEAYAADETLRERANLVILAGLRSGLDHGEDEQRRVIGGLLNAVDRHNLYGKVAYPPRHTQEEVQSLYALAAHGRGVFVNPALTEPYGLTLIEAATHGLPVVATRNGGPNDILAELEHGTLVDPRDTFAIAGAVGELLDDTALWQRKAARGRTQSREMTWAAYAKGFVQLVQEISAPRPVARTGQTEEMLVCDIDNTLTGCVQGARHFGHHVERARGLSFCIATGRSLVEARRILAEWELPRPEVLITSVGSEIYWAQQDGLHLDIDYAQRIGEDWQRDEIAQILAGMPNIVPQAPTEQRRWKLSYFAEDRRVVATVSHELASAGLRARVVHSHSRLLDVLPLHAGKGAAVRHVANRLGIMADKVCAVGDSGNDLDMLRSCSNAVLVGNHDEDLRELVGLGNVYVAKRRHAGGALEGYLHHAHRRRETLARKRAA